MSRQNDARGLRRSCAFPSGLDSPELKERLYEAQVSVLVTGVDEWVWTAYCCVETYFGSEKSVKHYHENNLDALTGGETFSGFPVWNPREYFISVLSRRLRQITKEWSNIVEALEQWLRNYVCTPCSTGSSSNYGLQDGSIFHEGVRQTSLTDDVKFSRTKEYTSTIEILRLLHNNLVKGIESWESFNEREMQYFEIRDNEFLSQKWEPYFASIEKNMTELRYFRRSLQQHIDALDSKRNGVSGI